MQVPEDILIQGCIDQDRRFQKLLYEQYCESMFTLAVRLCADYQDAEDALQEAFIQVFKHIHKFRKESTLGAWIKKIVVRTALKKSKKTSFPLESIEIADKEEMFESMIEKPIDIEYLEKCIFSLPQKCRQVFILAEVEGYSHEEIAELLQISVGTSKSQLHYAKQLLKQKLQPILK